MRILPLSDEARYVLSVHWRYEDATEDDGSPPQKTEPLLEAPVFIYRPLRPREKAQWIKRLYGDGEPSLGISNERYLDLVQDRLVRVENLEVGDAPFDKEAHLDCLDLSWQVELALEILNRASLDEDDLGKSS